MDAEFPVPSDSRFIRVAMIAPSAAVSASLAPIYANKAQANCEPLHIASDAGGVPAAVARNSKLANAERKPHQARSY